MFLNVERAKFHALTGNETQPLSLQQPGVQVPTQSWFRIM